MALEWSQQFSHYKSMGIFPDPQGQLTEQSVVESCLIPNLSKILWLSPLPSRIKKSNKNEGARVVTTLYIDFSDAQGQLTPELVVGSG